MQPFLHTSMYIVIHTNAVLPGLISALLVLSAIYLFMEVSLSLDIILCGSPQWGAADAEIKVPSGENAELKRSPFKAWMRSVYSHTCYAYCQEFLPYFYPSSSFTCIFSKTSPDFFPALAVANTGSCIGPQNKIGHPAGCRFPC